MIGQDEYSDKMTSEEYKIDRTEPFHLYVASQLILEKIIPDKTN